LFSPLNGWLIYSPVLVFTLLGLPFLLKNNRHNSLAILVVFVVNWYLGASWWMWYFGGALGYRPFVDLLPLLVFPFCFMIKKILEKGLWARAGLYVFLALAFAYSLRLHCIYSWKWNDSGFDWEGYRAIIREGFPFLGL
jgi:hypothetical protein